MENKMTPKQEAAFNYKFNAKEDDKILSIEEIFEAGWDARDKAVSDIIWEEKEVIMTDPFEIALAAFRNGYARGIKEELEKK